MAAPDPEIIAVDDALKERGLPRAALGRQLGLDSKQVSRIFSGERRVQRHEMAIIRDWLWPGSSPQLKQHGAIVPMPGLVPLYGWVGAASEHRLTLADQSIRGYVPMLPSQANMVGAFALEVADVSMVPRYEPGEIVYVAPNRWPVRNQDCVVVTNASEGYLKRFLRRDEDTLFLHQLNPDQDLDFQLEDVAAIHAVVGRA